MTIQDAAQLGQCVGCVFRLLGPGPHQCMGTQMGDTECPGRCAPEAQQPKEQNV